MSHEREILSLEPVGADPQVGLWLASLDDCRQRTLDALAEVYEDMLDVEPDGSDSIGSLLYHVALVEADWLFADILGPDVPPPDRLSELLPVPDRDDAGRLTCAAGEDLTTHLQRLEEIRAFVHLHVAAMQVDEFRRLRARDSWDVSPAWVIHHLLQHEAEHRSQIAGTRDSVARANT